MKAWECHVAFGGCVPGDVIYTENDAVLSPMYFREAEDQSSAPRLQNEEEEKPAKAAPAKAKAVKSEKDED